MKQILAIDAGGSSLKYGLYNEHGNELTTGGYKQIIRNDTTQVLNTFKEIIETHQNINGIALSIPGIFEKDTDIIIEGGSIEALLELKDLRNMLEEQYKVPVSLENDANCAALAEQWLGNGKGCDNFVCMTVGTGIGGGIIINGKLYKGSHGRSGEFHWLLQSPNTSDLFGIVATESLASQANTATSLTINNGIDFFNNIDHPQIKPIYNTWIKNISWGIYNIAYIIDPDKLLIGGGISAQQRIYQDITERIAHIAPHTYKWKVEPCFFNNNAGKIGAVYKLITTRFS